MAPRTSGHCEGLPSVPQSCLWRLGRGLLLIVLVLAGLFAAIHLYDRFLGSRSCGLKAPVYGVPQGRSLGQVYGLQKGRPSASPRPPTAGVGASYDQAAYQPDLDFAQYLAEVGPPGIAQALPPTARRDLGVSDALLPPRPANLSPEESAIEQEFEKQTVTLRQVQEAQRKSGMLRQTILSTKGSRSLGSELLLRQAVMPPKSTRAGTGPYFSNDSSFRLDSIAEATGNVPDIAIESCWA